MFRWLIPVLLFVASCPAAADPAWTAPGPHVVTHADVSWIDAARDRTVPMRIHAPRDLAGPLPVVVFSHGLGATSRVYAFLGRHLASHGYTCLHPQHPGSDAAVFEAGILGAVAAAADPIQRAARVADLGFVLDRLPVAHHPLLAGRIDLERIAAAGHSFGAYTALALGGQALSLPGRPDVAVSDPRIRAVVALSPIGSGVLGLHPGSWDQLQIPSLFITGTEDTTFGTADWLSRLEPFRSAPATPRYLAVLEGARHHAFGDYQMPFGPVLRDPRHHSWILTLVTAFLDARLKDDSAAAQWLIGEGPGRMAEGELRWEAVPTPSTEAGSP